MWWEFVRKSSHAHNRQTTDKRQVTIKSTDHTRRKSEIHQLVKSEVKKDRVEDRIELVK